MGSVNCFERFWLEASQDLFTSNSRKVPDSLLCSLRKLPIELRIIIYTLVYELNKYPRSTFIMPFRRLLTNANISQLPGSKTSGANQLHSFADEADRLDIAWYTRMSFYFENKFFVRAGDLDDLVEMSWVCRSLIRNLIVEIDTTVTLAPDIYLLLALPSLRIVHINIVRTVANFKSVEASAFGWIMKYLKLNLKTDSNPEAIVIWSIGQAMNETGMIYPLNKGATKELKYCINPVWDLPMLPRWYRGRRIQSYSAQLKQKCRHVRHLPLEASYEVFKYYLTHGTASMAL
ncbi:MAG: hypothetical protein M1834_009637 [Cirrosporium novae-zelandiae]|nr:MAG: hypothetical protein M1834_009637 [Cirrosporium novae-zelandiae]